MSWSGGLVEWISGMTVNISIVFSWKLQEAYQRSIFHKSQGYRVIVGGPAVVFNPDYLKDVAEIGCNESALEKHNPLATFTTRGCIRNCDFCIVHTLEPKFIEIKDWPVKPVICDNNFLASSDKHFNSVIDKLKPLKDIDFNQGLDARLLTQNKADRIASLNLASVRLSWDFIGMESIYLNAFQMFRRAGIPAKRIRTYVLIGHHDTPEDALYRLETIRKLGSRPNPMRYQPFNISKRNQFVSKNWTDKQLKYYMRYWSRLRWLEHIPFSEYKNDPKYRRQHA